MTSWKISSLTNRIRRSFNTAADRYDALSGLQKKIADGLCQKIDYSLRPKKILDIGCGTGYLTDQIKNIFPQSEVIGLDLSEQMTMRAQIKNSKISWITADAQQLPFKDQSFDLIVSNLAYQWAFDLPKTFSDTHRILSKEGTLIATLFGYHTCDELFSSLQATGSIKEEFNRLPQLEEVKEALMRASFIHIQLDSRIAHVHFKDLWDLLAWIKAIGANGLSNGQFLGPQALTQANEYCLRHHSSAQGIQITFEVISINAKK